MKVACPEFAKADGVTEVSHSLDHDEGLARDFGLPELKTKKKREEKEKKTLHKKVDGGIVKKAKAKPKMIVIA